MQTTATRPTPCHRARFESDAREAERAEDRAEANAEAKAYAEYLRTDEPVDTESAELLAIIGDAESGASTIEDSIDALKEKLAEVRKLLDRARLAWVRNQAHDCIERAEAWLAAHAPEAVESAVRQERRR